MCKRWLSSFNNFLQDMGQKPVGMTLERKNTDGDYEPSNCVWATVKQQANNRRTNLTFEFNGTTKNLKQWTEVYGIDYRLVWQRIYRDGMDPLKALTEIRGGGHNQSSINSTSISMPGGSSSSSP